MNLKRRFNDCAKWAVCFRRRLSLIFDCDGFYEKRLLDQARAILREDPRGEKFLHFAARSMTVTEIKTGLKAWGQEETDFMTKRPMVRLKFTLDDMERAATMLHEYRHVQQEAMEGKERDDFRSLRAAVVYNRLIEGDAAAIAEVVMDDIIDRKFGLRPAPRPLAARMEEAFLIRLRDEMDSYDRKMVLRYYQKYMKPPDKSMPLLNLGKSRAMLICGADSRDPKYMTALSDQALEGVLMKGVEKDVLAVIEAIDGYRESCADMSAAEAGSRKKEIGGMVRDMMLRGEVLKSLEKRGWAMTPVMPSAV